MKIVLIEDDEILVNLIISPLKKANYVVEVAQDGNEGLSCIRSTKADLWIIDLELPGVNGIYLCQKLRQAGCMAPILILTARSSGLDVLAGFNAGADDYLKKPFQISELLARVKALLRRPPVLQKPVLEWGVLTLNVETAEVTYAGKIVSLRPKEFNLLSILMRNGSRVLSYDQLIKELYKTDDTPNKESLKAHIKGLRRAIQKVDGQVDLIQGIRGLGVRLNPSYETVDSQQAIDNQDLLPELEAAWPTIQPNILTHIQVIKTALQNAKENHSSDLYFKQAQRPAHKLAGSLGTMGFFEASQLAKIIEEALMLPSVPLDDVIHKVDLLQLELTNRSSANMRSQEPLSLLLFGFSPSFSERIESQGTADRIKLKQVNTLVQLKRTLEESKPDVVVLDVLDKDILNKVSKLLKRSGIPFIANIGEDTLASRIQARKMGATGCVNHPVEPDLLLQTVHHVVLKDKKDQLKILAIDQESECLQMLDSVLSQYCRFYSLEDPRTFWPMIHNLKPDLLFLDMALTTLPARDICQAIRTDVRLNAIPVILMSISPQEHSSAQLWEMGASGCLSKPIQPQEIEACLLHHTRICINSKTPI